MQYTRDDVMDRLYATEYEFPEAQNKHVTLELEDEADTSWSPYGGIMYGPGTMTYLLYRSGVVHASFTGPDDAPETGPDHYI